MESISVLDKFKIGIGPSSSHTLGSWKTAASFARAMNGRVEEIQRLDIHLFGYLAKTGKGHGTDLAIMLGLSGEDPVKTDTTQIDPIVNTVRNEKQLPFAEKKDIQFDPSKQIHFLKEEKPFHSNALTFLCRLSDCTLVKETYYSVGSGFVVRVGEEGAESVNVNLPYPINSATGLTKWCRQTGLYISGVVAENEKAWRTEEETRAAVMKIWDVMRSCIYRSCHTEGELPGGLQVNRQASLLNNKLLNSPDYKTYKQWCKVIGKQTESFAHTLDWVSCFALAVNEENAAFGRVVTAPTNGAAGVIPAVLKYMVVFKENPNNPNQNLILKFLFTASEIGSIIIKRATISAAMGGCQAEIGVASAMAAIKAITASRLAINSDPDKARVSLDAVIQTMWETAKDMNSKYKETSEGGLAVNIPVSLSEC
jgi:L-serine dehydratase